MFVFHRYDVPLDFCQYETFSVCKVNQASGKTEWSYFVLQLMTFSF